MSEELGAKTDIIEFLELLKSLASDLDCAEEVNACSRLQEKLKKDEWYLTLLGETSSGKSTLANSFMDDDLLPATSSTTTGVVTLIQVSEGAVGDRFYPVDSQGRVGPEMSRSEFRKQANGTGTSKRLLVKKHSIPRLPAGVTVVDTPGFNSCVKEHVEVLNEYLPESDAVVFLLNYRLGLRAVDVEYFRLVTQLLEETTDGNDSISGLFVAVNFAPSPNEDKRVVEIRGRLKESTGYSRPIEILNAQRVNGNVVLENEALLEQIAAIVESPERARLLMTNTLRLAGAMLSRIGQKIRLKHQVFLTDEDNLAIIAARIEELRDMEQSMIRRVQLANEDLNDAIAETCSGRKLSIKRLIDEELSESSRWTSIDSARTYIAESLVECSINDTAHELSNVIRRHMELLNRDLDNLAANVDEKIHNLLDLPLDRLRGDIDERFLGKLAELLGGRGLGYYLSKLGGAIGDTGVVGVMNLARKLMGYANKLWGSTVFGREAMARVPEVLKQFGFTTSRVAGVAAAVALEVATYLFKVATWKSKLRKQLGPVIDEHVGDLERQALESGKDIIESTSQMVRDNYSRRIEVLSEALSDRKQGRSVDPEIMKCWMQTWSDLVDDLDGLGEKVKGV